MENLITKMVQYLASVTLRIYTKYRHKENGNARSKCLMAGVQDFEPVRLRIKTKYKIQIQMAKTWINARTEIHDPNYPRHSHGVMNVGRKGQMGMYSRSCHFDRRTVMSWGHNQQ
jgi:hypothetical protein